MVHHGVPFDVAFSLEPHEILGWIVIMGECSTGQKFNWSTMKWPDP